MPHCTWQALGEWQCVVSPRCSPETGEAAHSGPARHVSGERELRLLRLQRNRWRQLPGGARAGAADHALGLLLPGDGGGSAVKHGLAAGAVGQAPGSWQTGLFAATPLLDKQRDSGCKPGCFWPAVPGFTAGLDLHRPEWGVEGRGSWL